MVPTDGGRKTGVRSRNAPVAAQDDSDAQDERTDPVGQEELEFATVGPSQSDADAHRDGIIAELAAISAAERVVLIDEFRQTVWAQQIETPEAIYRISKPPYGSFTSDEPNDCTFGNRDGVPYRDFICISDYVEILLIDPVSAEILRAYPFREHR